MKKHKEIDINYDQLDVSKSIDFSLSLDTYLKLNRIKSVFVGELRFEIEEWLKEFYEEA